MRKLSLFATLAVASALLVAPPSAVRASDAADGVIPIPYTKYVLDNGLTLIVHQDHKAPVVAVNLWYDVGASDEKLGKTGFAHLFEHLMFNGSENWDDEYFTPLFRVGVTGYNGTTGFDRTNYFQVVPKTALDLVLWMESDRMGHLLGAITQEKLDEQRGVVQNEKRQSENQPYGKAFLTIFENTYPEGHPYDHWVIGSMEDLDAASLEDVHEWFKQYYGAANAVIVVAGDVEPEDVKARVEKFFGDIPAGPPLVKLGADVQVRTQPSRRTMQDRVPQARVYKAWNVAAYQDPDVELLDVLSDVLAGGKSSRLYKRLVYDEQIATDVSASNYTRQLGGLFIITATVQPGGNIGDVEAAIEEELARLIAEGPTEEELARSKTSQRAAFVRGIERVGGFGGKSDILAMSQVFLGSPDAHEASQSRVLDATAEEVRKAAERWFGPGVFTLEIHPFPEYAVAESAVDRSTGPPEVTEFPESRFPERQTTTLSNGLEVILARRDAVPVVELDLLLNAGYASDQFAHPGTANLAQSMLDEGTTTRSALEISDELDRLGATLGAGSNLDLSWVQMSALKENLEPSLELFADVILNPSFPENELERLRRLQLAGIQREKVQPVSMALRVFPRLLYGEGHAYGLPLTGSGTEESVAAISKADLEKFHSTWFRPGNAKLVIVGDTTLDKITPHLERLFEGWESGTVPSKNLAKVKHQPRSVVYLVDRPGSEQSIIFAGHVMPPKNNPDELAIDALNGILGATFASRLNMNLREDKGWTYGARSYVSDAAAQRPFFVYVPVQGDKTKESMAEIQKELTGIRSGGELPPAQDELARVMDQKTLTLPGRWETNGAVLNDIIEIIRFGYDDDYWEKYPAAIRALGLDSIEKQADAALHPDKMVWVVVGDRSKIEAGIRELDLGEIRLIDVDGNPLGD